MENEILLPLKAAARAIGVRPENLRAEADAGKVPHTKLGDDYLFGLKALETSLLARIRKMILPSDEKTVMAELAREHSHLLELHAAKPLPRPRKNKAVLLAGSAGERAREGVADVRR
jgi:hypothetical protein